MRIKYGSQHWHTVTVGYKMPTTVSTQTKGPLFTQKATAVQQLSHGEKKTGDNHAVTIVPQNRILFLFSLSLSLSSTPSHTLTHSRWSIGHQLRTGGVGVSRQQTTRTMGNQFGFLFMERKHYRLSSMIVAFCTVITCVFLYSKYTLAYSTWNWCSASLYCSKVIKPQTFQDQFKDNKINETTRVMDLGV